MKTRVLRIDLDHPDLGTYIAAKCDVQLDQGFKLAAAFPVDSDLILIFQALPAPAPA